MNWMNRREFLKATAATAAVLAGPQWLQAANTTPGVKPNIILILADDIGIPGLGCYGGEFTTPHLDNMAKAGMRFDQCFTQSLCAPSRAMLMTGRFPFRTGAVSNSARSLRPTKETVIPKILKEAGYATALAGKWSQMAFMETAEEGKAWGFDEFLTWDGAEGGRYWKPSLCRDGKSVAVTEKDFGPDLLNDYVIDFIGRKKNEPFFVYYPMTLIHSHLYATPDGKSGRGLLADNIAYMDKLVGKVLSKLDELKLRENTLVLFSGDNGLDIGGRMNGRPISGGKGSLLDGGSRVPLIASWEGTIPAGKVVNDLVEFSDVYATLAELSGAKLPAGIQLDSQSFAPQLKGEAGKPRDWVFIQLADEWYVRDQHWKLTRAGTLFDMKEAPFKEIQVAPDAADPTAIAGRKKLQGILDELRPTGSKRGDREEEGGPAGRKREATKPVQN
ncbi:sulfatase-like hydrolase/transferase [soil metagenome]